MRLRSWILPALLASPLLFPVDRVIACMRFKKPAGAVKNGLREPSDPPPPPVDAPPTTPTDPSPTTPTGPTTPSGPSGPVTPSAPTPTTGGDGGDAGERKKQGDDSSTWETWWLMNRIEFFPHRYVNAVTTSEGPVQKGAKPLAAQVVREKLWKPLLALKDNKEAFVREASLITIGRVASDESLKQEAREILLNAINDKNKLVARAAALGLFYVADESCVFPMVKLAENAKTPTDVRAFLAMTLTAMKSDMAGPFLIRLVSADKDADFELVASAIMALGYIPGPESARFLKETYANHKFRAELRAEAVESFGRRGSFEDGEAVLRDAIDDREVDIRRSAAIALGILDYRTPSQRQIEELKAPFDLSTGQSLPADVQAKVAELAKATPAEAEKMQKPIRDIVKKLVHALENDNDSFTCSMCAISLGRIASQVEEGFAIRRLLADLKKERNVVREYEILALAIAKAPEAYAVAVDAIEGRNRQATTQGAGMIALGILGDARGTPILKKLIEENEHPVLRGLAALGAGMLGDEKVQSPIMTMLKSTKSPDAMSLGALGLALLGKKQGSDMLIKRLSETSNGDVASYNVYSLGLMKDRSKLDSLIDTAQNHGNFFVQSAAVAAIGYVSSAEDYPRRHLMARGFNYMLNLNLLENYFYKL